MIILEAHFPFFLQIKRIKTKIKEIIKFKLGIEVVAVEVREVRVGIVVITVGVIELHFNVKLTIE